MGSGDELGMVIQRNVEVCVDVCVSPEPGCEVINPHCPFMGSAAPELLNSINAHQLGVRKIPSRQTLCLSGYEYVHSNQHTWLKLPWHCEIHS